MTTDNAFAGKIGPLEVRVRHTVAPDGNDSAQSSVFCPFRGASVSVKKCALCEHFGGLVSEPSGTTLLCHRRLPAPPSDGAEHACDPRETQVSEIMKSAECVRSDTGLEAAAKRLLELGVSGLPVVDAKGHLEGILSSTDIVRHHRVMADSPWDTFRNVQEVRVSEVMTRHPYAIPETASIADAAALMASGNIHRLPVVSSTGEVVAIVSPLDILAWLAL
ncbi:CBS domain-containing protein [bacterium]|nr:CBS domain-containing protein [bacterium]